MGSSRPIGVVVTILFASSAWAQPSPGRANVLQREASLVRQESLAMRAPIEALRSASWFESGAVGIAGRTPATVRAWQKIARGKAPAAVFASLLSSDSTAARLYGLVGLYVFDHQAFTQAAAQERARGDSVMTLIGCIASQQAAAPLVGPDRERRLVAGLPVDNAQILLLARQNTTERPGAVAPGAIALCRSDARASRVGHDCRRARRRCDPGTRRSLGANGPNRFARRSVRA
jgi:hypothetical protein